MAKNSRCRFRQSFPVLLRISTFSKPIFLAFSTFLNRILRILCGIFQNRLILPPSLCQEASESLDFSLSPAYYLSIKILSISFVFKQLRLFILAFSAHTDSGGNFFQARQGSQIHLFLHEGAKNFAGACSAIEVMTKWERPCFALAFLVIIFKCGIRENAG